MEDKGDRSFRAVLIVRRLDLLIVYRVDCEFREARGKRAGEHRPGSVRKQNDLPYPRNYRSGVEKISRLIASYILRMYQWRSHCRVSK